MKKYFLMLLSFIFLATINVGLVSCGDEDEEVIPKDETSASNDLESPNNQNSSDSDESGSKLTSEEQKFVGLWRMSVGGSSHTFIFLSNGKAIRDGESNGQWQYNPTTGILATTIGMWQFKISAIFDNAWTGVTVNTGRAVNASRGDDTSLLESLFKLIDFTQTQSDGTTYNPLMIKLSYTEEYFFDAGFYKVKGYEKKGNYEWNGYTNINNNNKSIVADIEFYFTDAEFGIEYSYTYGRNIKITNIDSDFPVLVVKKTYSYYKYTRDYGKTIVSKYDISDDVDFPKEGTFQGKWKK